MHILSFSVSLTVSDVPTSASFLTRHFGFLEKTAADGFASLLHEQSGINVIYLRKGIDVLPEDFRDEHAQGVIVALVTTNLEAEEQRLKQEGVLITMPLRIEPWGEKLFQVKDPNGIVIQLVEWVN